MKKGELTKEKIISGNKLIAEFLGAKIKSEDGEEFAFFLPPKYELGIGHGCFVKDLKCRKSGIEAFYYNLSNQG